MSFKGLNTLLRRLAGFAASQWARATGTNLQLASFDLSPPAALSGVLAQLHALKHPADNAPIQPPSPQAVGALQRGLLQLRAHERKTVAALLAGGICVFALSRLLAAAYFLGAFWYLLKLDAYLELHTSMEPLSKDIGHTRGRVLAHEFPACNAYRKAVFLQGREFLQLDLELMDRIAARENEILANKSFTRVSLS